MDTTLSTIETEFYHSIQDTIRRLEKRCRQLKNINVPIRITAEVIRRARFECSQMERNLKRFPARGLTAIETVKKTKRAIRLLLSNLGLKDIAATPGMKKEALAVKNLLLSKLTDEIKRGTLPVRVQQKLINGIACVLHGNILKNLTEIEQLFIEGLFMGISKWGLEIQCTGEDMRRSMSELLTSTDYERIRAYFDPFACLGGWGPPRSLVYQDVDVAVEDVDSESCDYGEAESGIEAPVAETHAVQVNVEEGEIDVRAAEQINQPPKSVNLAAERAARAKRRAKERKVREKDGFTMTKSTRRTQRTGETKKTKKELKAGRESAGRIQKRQTKIEKRGAKAAKQQPNITPASAASVPLHPQASHGRVCIQSDPIAIESDSIDEAENSDTFYDCLENQDDIAAINARSASRNDAREFLNNLSPFDNPVSTGEAVDAYSLISSGTLDTDEIMWD